MGKIKSNFNSEVKAKLSSKGISIHDGISYLLCLYYGTQPSYVPKELERKIFASGIVNKDYSSDTIVWRISLFEEQQTGYEWIKDWMDLFKSKNPERRGIKRDVLTRMKKFFVNNPAIRKDDVIAATKLYLRNVDNPKYCKKSHKFIYEQDGTSMLLDYVTQLKEQQTRTHKYSNDII